MIESGAKNINSFHLAGIVPVASQPLDFNFPWHDSLMPIGKDYLAVERAVLECAWAGCETIWVVCHREMQPIIKDRLGEWIFDPNWLLQKEEFLEKFSLQTCENLNWKIKFRLYPIAFCTFDFFQCLHFCSNEKVQGDQVY